MGAELVTERALSWTYNESAEGFLRVILDNERRSTFRAPTRRFFACSGPIVTASCSVL